MKGRDLIKWIKDNNAEDLDITYPYLSACEVFDGYAEKLNPRIVKKEGRVEL